MAGPLEVPRSRRAAVVMPVLRGLLSREVIGDHVCVCAYGCMCKHMRHPSGRGPAKLHLEYALRVITAEEADLILHGGGSMDEDELLVCGLRNRDVVLLVALLKDAFRLRSGLKRMPVHLHAAAATSLTTAAPL